MGENMQAKNQDRKQQGLGMKFASIFDMGPKLGKFQTECGDLKLDKTAIPLVRWKKISTYGF